MKKQTYLIQLIFFLLLFPLFSINTIVGQVTANHQMEVLYPLYVYPFSIDDNGTPSNTSDDTEIFNWENILEAQKKVKVTVIINPSSGPSLSTWDMDKYRRGIKKLRDAGVVVVAYVKTGWLGMVNDWHPYFRMQEVVPRILWDVETYYRKYHLAGITLDGIFFDEAYDNSSKKNMYRLLYDNVKSYVPRWQVILNPGYNAPVDYLGLNDNVRVADIIVTYESAHSQMGTQANNNGTNKHPYNYSAMIHSVTSTTNMNNTIDQTWNNGFGYIFVTDDVYVTTVDNNPDNDNPYDKVPSTFWNNMIQYIHDKNKENPRKNNRRKFIEGKDRLLWNQMPGTAVQIAIGGTTPENEKIYKLGPEKLNGDWRIHNWSKEEKNWVLWDGALKKIVADDDGNLWGINSSGDIYYRAGKDEKWVQFPGIAASDITVAGKAPNTKVFILNRNKIIRPKMGISPGGHELMELNISQKTFSSKNVGANNISVDKNGNLFVQGVISNFFFNNATNTWKREDDKVFDNKFFALNGHLYGIDVNFSQTIPHKFNFKNSSWEKVNFFHEVHIKDLVLDTSDVPWIIANDDKIYIGKVY